MSLMDLLVSNVLCNRGVGLQCLLVESVAPTCGPLRYSPQCSIILLDPMTDLGLSVLIYKERKLFCLFCYLIDILPRWRLFVLGEIKTIP